MELGILNELGYFEVIEISIWLGVMYLIYLIPFYSNVFWKMLGR
jgi:hypothetical protein